MPLFFLLFFVTLNIKRLKKDSRLLTKSVMGDVGLGAAAWYTVCVKVRLGVSSHQ